MHACMLKLIICTHRLTCDQLSCCTFLLLNHVLHMHMHISYFSYVYLHVHIPGNIFHCTQGCTSKQVLELVARAMSDDVELWTRYFNDFVLHKLRLDSEDSAGGIAQQMLYTFMSQLHSLEALKRVIHLHAYLHVYQLDLAKLASILRPLNKLHKVLRLQY